jgi:hypothetical protein
MLQDVSCWEGEHQEQKTNMSLGIKIHLVKKTKPNQMRVLLQKVIQLSPFQVPWHHLISML